MAYDAKKDVKIAEEKALPGDNDSRILVGIFSYHGGPRKIRVNRLKLRGGDAQVGKLGGLSKAEALEIAAALVRMANHPSLNGEG